MHAKLLLLAMSALPNLDALRWHSRVLLAFAPTPNNTQVLKQSEMVRQHETAFAERNLEFFIVADTAEGRPLRDKFGIKADSFVVLLIGKDGLVKLRRSNVISAEDLFGTIDRMPMRREEMARQR